MYSEKVMDHFMHPRNVGEIENADGIGEVGNAKCGDIMRIYLKIDNGIITDVKFKTFGCGAAIADYYKRNGIEKEIPGAECTGCCSCCEHSAEHNHVHEHDHE